MEQEENRRKPTVRGIWEELLRLVYPPKCVFCGTLLEREEQDACKACLAELPWTDESSAVRTGRAFSRCVSPFFLTGKVRPVSAAGGAGGEGLWDAPGAHLEEVEGCAVLGLQ